MQLFLAAQLTKTLEMRMYQGVPWQGKECFACYNELFMLISKRRLGKDALG